MCNNDSVDKTQTIGMKPSEKGHRACNLFSTYINKKKQDRVGSKHTANPPTHLPNGVSIRIAFMIATPPRKHFQSFFSPHIKMDHQKKAEVSGSTSRKPKAPPGSLTKWMSETDGGLRLQY
jgi:hypothetical protein